jgi:AraC-like DNA-binding protein
MGADVQQFVGTEGLRRLSESLLIDVQHPHRFRARVRAVDLDSTIYIDEVAISSPVSVRLQPRSSALPPLVMIHVLLEGRYRLVGDGDPLGAEAAGAIAIDSRAAVRFESSGPVRLLRLVTRLDALRPYSGRAELQPFGPLVSGPLLVGLSAILRAVLDSGRDGRQPGEHLVAALQELVAHLIAEAAPAQPATSRGEQALTTMKQLIERRLGDPRLSAVSLAAELEISVRRVHQLFEPEGTTVARFIQDRRLHALAVQLRTATAPAQTADLARAFGFGGADQLRRAFRRRYGVTIQEYREDAQQYRL